jgi:hypothetical protein
MRAEGGVAEFSDQVVDFVEGLVEPGGGGSVGEVAGR